MTVVDTGSALAAAYSAEFAYAVVEVQFRDRKGLDLVRKLRLRQAEIQIVVITDHDSFATVILALRAGADDYLPMPVSEHELTDALLGVGRRCRLYLRRRLRSNASAGNTPSGSWSNAAGT